MWKSISYVISSLVSYLISSLITPSYYLKPHLKQRIRPCAKVTVLLNQGIYMIVQVKPTDRRIEARCIMYALLT